MPWEDFLLPIKPSRETRQFQNDQRFNGKYIGIIPLNWNPLAFYKKPDYLEETLNNLDLLDIKTITTSKDLFLVHSIFYHLIKQKEKYYPIFKYDAHLPFNINNLKDSFSTWLSEIGYLEPHFIPIRIYKMKGFHLFVLLLDHQIPSNKLNPDWQAYTSLPILQLKDQEITNSMMKVSRNHYYQKERLKELNLHKDYWDQLMNGYVIEEDLVFPFQINFEQIIATLSNQIDSHSDRYKNLYFKPNIRKRSNNFDILSLYQASKRIKI